MPLNDPTSSHIIKPKRITEKMRYDLPKLPNVHLHKKPHFLGARPPQTNFHLSCPKTTRPTIRRPRTTAVFEHRPRCRSAAAPVGRVSACSRGPYPLGTAPIPRARPRRRRPLGVVHPPRWASAPCCRRPPAASTGPQGEQASRHGGSTRLSGKRVLRRPYRSMTFYESSGVGHTCKALVTASSKQPTWFYWVRLDL